MIGAIRTQLFYEGSLEDIQRIELVLDGMQTDLTETRILVGLNSVPFEQTKIRRDGVPSLGGNDLW